MRANQLRLYFSSLAYVLMYGAFTCAVDSGEGTQMAHAQSTTIRLKLLKIGARLRITVRQGRGGWRNGWGSSWKDVIQADARTNAGDLRDTRIYALLNSIGLNVLPGRIGRDPLQRLIASAAVHGKRISNTLNELQGLLLSRCCLNLAN